MVNGLSIESLKGTPLYSLAQNANVNGGKTLSGAEMFAFQSQMNNMGWTPEQFGLAISSEEMAGENAKETRKNMVKAGEELKKSYKAQFGSKQAAEAAKNAEDRADSTVRVAYQMFAAEHADIVFVPKNLGNRPKYTAPKYMDDVARYAADLATWANGVQQEYIGATKMTNSQLAAAIINNDNENTRDIMINDNINADQISKQIQDGTAQVIEEVKDATGQVIQTVKSAEGHIVKTVKNAEGRIIQVVRQEGAATRMNDDLNTIGLHEHIDYNTAGLHNHISAEGAMTRANDNVNAKIVREDIKNTVTEEGEKTRNKVDEESKKIQKLIKEKGDEVIDTLDPMYVKRAVKGLRDAAAAAGKSVMDFVKEHPGLLFGGIPGYLLIDRN